MELLFLRMMYYSLLHRYHYVLLNTLINLFTTMSIHVVNIYDYLKNDAYNMCHCTYSIIAYDEPLPSQQRCL